MGSWAAAERFWRWRPALFDFLIAGRSLQSSLLQTACARCQQKWTVRMLMSHGEVIGVRKCHPLRWHADLHCWRQAVQHVPLCHFEFPTHIRQACRGLRLHAGGHGFLLLGYSCFCDGVQKEDLIWCHEIWGLIFHVQQLTLYYSMNAVQGVNAVLHSANCSNYLMILELLKF